MDTNIYTAVWYNAFPPPSEHTERQVEFLASVLRESGARSVLDVACGAGRHAFGLAHQGFDVLGIDTNREILPPSTIGGSPQFRAHDMRMIDSLGISFDAVICLWQSFGFFSDEVNAEVLSSFRRALSPGGIAILDIYCPGYWPAETEGPRISTRNTPAGTELTTTARRTGSRLGVSITEPEGSVVGDFDWRLYEPGEIDDLASMAGLRTIQMCRQFDLSLAPSAESSAYQIVFQRPVAESYRTCSSKTVAPDFADPHI
ncbi:class I SAM-dependent methyltransferase [Nesterenkonia ebinurensis]|uniref:class I SAM-dependent methyltransferase n=1 Tax=Nesterenkonia ebinurensis TaxID=2608252 RepID=UPI00123D2292